MSTLLIIFACVSTLDGECQNFTHRVALPEELCYAQAQDYFDKVVPLGWEVYGYVCTEGGE